jgi:hypothetical protein
MITFESPASGAGPSANTQTSTSEMLARAKKMAQKESLNIRLAMLREKYGVKQSEITTFTQTAVSKLENRKDMRISTLIDYLDSLGMGLEITACPKNSNRKELLLRI